MLSSLTMLRANGYQAQELEKWIGEWMAKRNVRDDVILATKYSAGYKGLHDNRMLSNYGGNSAKSLHVSLEDSLKKLQTSYIDLVFSPPSSPIQWCLLTLFALC